MANKVKVKLPDGEEREATPVEVNQPNEHWNSYLLEDGSFLKVKLVITKVARVDNLYDNEGNPVYSFQSTNVTSVDSPEELKRRG